METVSKRSFLLLLHFMSLELENLEKVSVAALRSFYFMVVT